MPRIRTIKPEFWTDEKVGSLPVHARLLFIGMWNLSDDYGVLKGNHALLKAHIFPYDDAVRFDQLKSWIGALVSARMLIPFSVRGESYLYIRTFRDHQVINRPSSNRNCSDEELESAINAHEQLETSTLTEDSLSNHGGLTLGKGKGKGKGKGIKDIARSFSEKTKTKRAVALVDDDLLISLSENPAYEGIDVRREYGKMQAWLQTPRGKGKLPTKARFVNWLNRAEPTHGPPKMTRSEQIDAAARRALEEFKQDMSCNEEVNSDEI